MTVRLRTIITASVALLAAAAAPARAAAPRRVVSLNACADQLLLALADRAQVAALTQYARDPTLSFAAKAAAGWPTTRGDAESLWVIQPDLVITTPYRRSDQLSLLRGRTPILELKPAKSFADIVAQTRKVARAIGHPERGEALIADMQARVARAGARPRAGTVANYQRGGLITGRNTLLDELMDKAGLTNLARTRAGVKRLSLEEIVAARPDWLIVGGHGSVGQDQGGQLLEHPALLRAVPAAHRIVLPSVLTVCGGPSYPTALEWLQAAVDRARSREAAATSRR